MKKKRTALWIVLVIAVTGILLWQTGAVNYFLARTIFAPDFEEELLPGEDSTAHRDEEGDEKEPVREEEGERHSIENIDYEIEVVAENLEIPWEIVHLPDGRILVTERPGRVKILDEGEIATIHSVEHAGEGGLLGMALSPTFEEDAYLYLYYTYREDGDFYNRVARYTFEEDQIGEEEVVIEGIPGGRIHNGGRIKFGPDEMLYIATGDAADPELAQNVDSLAGMILRLHPDGGIPEDNPFDQSPVYAYGIRNPQGLAWHPGTEELFSSGHGPTRLDVINHIHPGGNYGWPEITCDEEDSDFEEAVVCYTEFTLAPSGMDFYHHEDLVEESLYVAGLRGNMVMRIDFNREGEFLRQEALFQDYGRIRTVVYHEGSLYIATNNRDGRGVPASEDDRIIRITPILLE
ncbi:PQQ-dependent sugar dehydrogenase [Isachenkonia alkalipeptolytica]|uniref:PQQ-dependent sugar dehydrogenase n=1 Tax=Isachenkonia alkalipeptolytica TaxID=2565777 RepID=A0AA43XKQ8_9CLOT|nr:PQQ-dependent sugar dehydrogenase [Isachenkonia alkalipeptolytica]NBG88432.1 PQQ-dependent sugar dehydrogenase [Isachenkonia alkalipeptolytica]